MSANQQTPISWNVMLEMDLEEVANVLSEMDLEEDEVNRLLKEAAQMSDVELLL